MKLNHTKSLKFLLALSLATITSQISAIKASLLGFAVVAESYVVGEFEGGYFDKTVKLDNGMVFEFNTCHYTYSYRPKATVYAKTFSIPELKKMGVKNPTQPIKLYRLLIEDYIYDVFRIR
jgi:hypothetical protein